MRPVGSCDLPAALPLVEMLEGPCYLVSPRISPQALFWGDLLIQDGGLVKKNQARDKATSCDYEVDLCQPRRLQSFVKDRYFVLHCLALH